TDRAIPLRHRVLVVLSRTQHHQASEVVLRILPEDAAPGAFRHSDSLDGLRAYFRVHAPLKHVPLRPRVVCLGRAAEGAWFVLHGRLTLARRRSLKRLISSTRWPRPDSSPSGSRMTCVTAGGMLSSASSSSAPVLN